MNPRIVLASIGAVGLVIGLLGLGGIVPLTVVTGNGGVSFSMSATGYSAAVTDLSSINVCSAQGPHRGSGMGRCTTSRLDSRGGRAVHPSLQHQRDLRGIREMDGKGMRRNGYADRRGEPWDSRDHQQDLLLGGSLLLRHDERTRHLHHRFKHGEQRGHRRRLHQLWSGDCRHRSRRDGDLHLRDRRDLRGERHGSVELGGNSGNHLPLLDDGELHRSGRYDWYLLRRDHSRLLEPNLQRHHRSSHPRLRWSRGRGGHPGSAGSEGRNSRDLLHPRTGPGLSRRRMGDL